LANHAYYDADDHYFRTQSAVTALTTLTTGGLVSYVPIFAGGGNLSDGDVMLRLNGDRPWDFKQSGADAGAGLVLQTTSASKAFHIRNVAGADCFTFVPFDSPNAPYFRVLDNGGTDYVSFSHNGTNFLMTGVNTASLVVSGMATEFNSGVSLNEVTLNILDATVGNTHFNYNNGQNYITHLAGEFTRFRNKNSTIFDVKDTGITWPSGVASFTGTSTGNANINYLRFLQSDGTTRDGYIGVGSASSRDIYLKADAGNVQIQAPSGSIYLDSNLYFGPSYGLTEITGDYGSVQTTSQGKGDYTGFSCEGALVFMLAEGETAGGIYDDTNNRWKIRTDINQPHVGLYNASTVVFQTSAYNSTGITSGAIIRDHPGNFRAVGFNTLSDFNNNVSDTLEAGHCGALAFTNNTTAYTLTLAASSDLDFPVDGVTTVVNAGTSGNYTITEGASTTLYFVEPGSGRVDTAGGCTVGPGGVATIWRESSTVYYIWGSEITP
jgi:hypothetical protein